MMVVETIALECTLEYNYLAKEGFAVAQISLMTERRIMSPRRCKKGALCVLRLLTIRLWANLCNGSFFVHCTGSQICEIQTICLAGHLGSKIMGAGDTYLARYVVV